MIIDRFIWWKNKRAPINNTAGVNKYTEPGEVPDFTRPPPFPLKKSEPPGQPQKKEN